MGRAGTLMPTATGPFQGNDGFDNKMINNDSSHIIKVNDMNGQWNTDRHGPVPFMGYQQMDGMQAYPGQSQTMVQKPSAFGAHDDHLMD